MLRWRTLLVVGILASPAAAADPAKVRTLTGKSFEGELVRIDEKKLEFRTKDGPVSVSFTELLDVELASPGSSDGSSKRIDVALNDGSVFHCSQYTLKKNEVTLSLQLGKEIRVPLASIAWIVNDAQDAAVREDWQKQLAKQSNHDMIVVKKNNVTNALEGTLGQGDESGERIEFDRSGTKYQPNLANIHGMSFFRPNETVEDPLCKVHDTGKNLLFARTIAATDSGLTVTTLSGVKVEYSRQLLARLDFSKGKLTFLSDLEPVKVVETSSLEGIDHYRRDKNLDGGPLRIKNNLYSKGLSLHAYTELVYDVGGSYKDFKAVVGVDDLVGGDSNVVIVVEGDDRELKTVAVSRKDKKPIELALNIKNVKLLKIVVKSANILDLGDHVDLADAKVSK